MELDLKAERHIPLTDDRPLPTSSVRNMTAKGNESHSNHLRREAKKIEVQIVELIIFDLLEQLG